MPAFPLTLKRRLPVESIRKALDLLEPKDRRKVFLAAFLQMSLGILDLIGIALIGLVATVAVSGIDKSQLPDWFNDALTTLGLQDLTKSQLAGLIGAVAVITLVTKTGLSAYISRRVIRFLANRQAGVSARLARDFLSRPLLDVQRWSTAEVLYCLSAGVGAAVVGVLGAGIAALAEIFLFVIVAVTLFLVDPVLTLIAGVLFGAILLVLQVWLGRMSARNARLMAEAAVGTTTAVQEALSTYREATVLHRRELYVKRFESLVGTTAGAVAANQYILEIPKYVLETTLILASFCLAIFQFVTKDLTAAATTVALFLTAGFRIIPAMLRLQAAGINMRNGAEGARLTFTLADFLERTPAPPGSEHRGDLNADRIRARIAAGHEGFVPAVDVVDASLTYVDADVPALAEATLHAPPGSSVALVGSTGAGKSTLADVILGVLEPQQGTVTISGVSPREAIERWPGAMAYVPQAVALVDGTVRENVALGLPRAAVDDDLVWEALERAHLAEFLRDSREGLDTVIGERGIRLSGGQRQRLGIARALYTRPLLLVLDEATSALDAETEQAIVRTLQELEGTVTTITVAHRLATVRIVDQLLYMSDGRIMARGSFEEVRSKVPDFDRQAALLGL